MLNRICPLSLKFPIMLVVLALTALAVPASASDEPSLDLALSFSTDGGKTWYQDFPMLETPGVVKVRVNWSNVRPAGEREVYTSHLHSDQTDFASANQGKQSHEGRVVWRQRLRTYWLGSTSSRYEYDLDLRARPEGVMGVSNVYDANAKKYADGSLPACAALGKGTYKFTVSVSYWLKKVTPNKLVAGSADFFVTIGQKPLASATAPAAKVLPFDRQTMEVTPADFEMDSTAATLLNAPPQPQKEAFARLIPGSELQWVLTDVPAGKYYLSLILSSNARVYLDGELVKFATLGKPGQIGGIWFYEYRTALPLQVSPGTEVRVAMEVDAVRIGRLGLHKNKLPRGPIDIRGSGYLFGEDKVRLTSSLQLGKTRDQAATAAFTATNVLSKPVEAHLTARVLNYFQVEVGRFEQKLTLEPRKTFEGQISFPWSNSDRYRLVVDVAAGQDIKATSVADIYADAQEPCRGKVWLNGTWQFTGMGDAIKLTAPLKDAKWEDALVPGRSPNSIKQKEHCGWFRRTFTVPDWLPGQKRTLFFERICYEGVVFLNGKQVGHNMGWQAPLEVDVTEFLRPGENELLVGVRDGIAALLPEEQVNGPLEHHRKSNWPSPTDRAGMGDVYLLGYPDTAITAVAARTSFRKKELALHIELPKVDAPLKLRNHVYFEGQLVLTLDDIQVQPGQTLVEATKSWPEPILWEIGKGRLLQLNTELLDAQGKRLDLVQTRFGFKEFWAENARLMLNGVATNFRAYAMNSDWGYTERMQIQSIRQRVRTGMAVLGTMERHIYDNSCHYAVCDEEGMPVACGVTGEAGPSQFKFENDIFWRNTEDLSVRRIRWMRNHPSIMQWYISNEFTECAPDMTLATKRMVDVRDAVVKHDPTRICEAGCDLDLRGALDIISTHYPVDIGGIRDVGTFLPDAALWYPRGKGLTPGMAVPAGQVKRVANVRGETPFLWGVKPILINETGWSVFYGPLFGYTVISGDDTFRGPGAAGEVHAIANEWFMAGHRDAEASLITPWHHAQSGLIPRLLPPLDIFPFSRTAQWYAGSPVQWDVSLFHDTGTPETLTFAWSLIDADGKTLAADKADINFPAYGMNRQKVSFTAPSVKAPMPASLRLALLRADGSVALEKSFQASIWPITAVAVSPKVRIGLFDPENTTAAAMERLGVKPIAIVAISKDELAKLDVLIIGENVGTVISPSSKEIIEFVEAGGRVLCLQQEKGESWLGGVGAPAHGQVSSTNFMRAPHHPVMKGFTASDLTFWHNDHVVSRSAYPKPVTGNAITLIDCGNATTGLDLSNLLEVRVGRGSIMLSQMMFANRPGLCPQADRLFGNMLQYLAGYQAPADATAVAIAEPSSSLAVAFARLGAGIQNAQAAKLGQAQVVLVDVNSEITPEIIAGLKACLENGGQVLLQGAGVGHRDMVKQIAGTEVRFTTPTPPNFVSRMILFWNDPLTDGLSNQDFFWNRQPETENHAAPFDDKHHAIEPLLECAYEGPGVEALGYPSGLARVKTGKGTLYLSSVKWDTAAETRRLADRMIYTLLGNMGVKFKLTQRAERLTNLEYQPLDIAKHLNRTLADQVAEDGKGGFTDQGADSDLRELPTGRQIMAGVPFDIATPKSCLTLASKYRPGDAPMAVEGIKIGRRADALFFLHTCAWTGRGVQATYRINYADGKTFDIPLSGSTNLRDWAASNPDLAFAFETGTLTRAGWTGSCKHFPKVSVYVMQWANPRPEVELVSFDFISGNQGVPVMLAVTSGVKRAEETFVKGDAQAANVLDEQARQAAQAGDRVKAMELARAALAKDATCTAARSRLADLLVEDGKIEQAEIELRRVVQIDPQYLEAYLKIGTICERAKRWDDAMAIYRQSLQANVNQPPVLQALERVKKQAR